MSDLVQFQKDIRGKQLKPFYILYGEEIGLMNVYLNQLPNVVREESVASVWRTLTQKGLVENSRTFVVRDDKDFLSNEARWKKLTDVKYGTLVLCVTKMDKRSKLLKAYPDNCVEFEKMTDVQLSRYFHGKYHQSLSADIIEQVIELCLNDYSRIDNELDKISRVAKASQDFAVSQVARKVEVDVFSIVDAVISYQPQQAVTLVHTLFERGESALGVLTLLYQSFNNACLVLGTKDAKESTLGIKQFLINKINREFDYSLESAFEGMTILGEAIEGIKNGRYTEQSAVYISLFKIFNLS